MIKRLVVLFSGTGTNLAYILEHLHNQGEFDVVLALSNNPHAKGVEIAKKYEVDTKIIDHKAFDTRQAFDAKVIDVVSSYHPHLTILAGFMRVVTPLFTNQIKAINLHPSLLPKYKGLHAIERSFESGDSEAGVSVHWVTSELDGGDIILQKSFQRTQSMRFEDFEKRIKTIEKEALKEAIINVLA